jgi:phage terminase small subunit
MPRRTKRKDVPPNELVPVGSTGSSATTTLVATNTPAAAPTLQEVFVILTPIEESFAKHFVLCNNATRAYIEATAWTRSRASARVMAWEMSTRPHVLRRIREYESASALACVIDYAAILDHDRAIVEGFKHADQVSQHIWQCCRYCYGTDHEYQWIDACEYYEALSKAEEKNEERRARKLGARDLPTEKGGYGFDVQADPNILCPRCEGRGTHITIIADTTRLEGPARVIVKGVKVTASGIEVVYHDIDKAKERLLRAAGMFKDDAASVARGAAAGAAAGAVAAIAAAKAADTMTAEQAQRLYLELA